MERLQFEKKISPTALTNSLVVSKLDNTTAVYYLSETLIMAHF